MIIVRNNLIPFKGFTALTIAPFIFVRKDAEVTDTVLRHERIHAWQQIELLWVLFLVLYIVFWLIGLVKLRSWKKAYRWIPFEKEAYTWQHDEEYLKGRWWCDWVWFMFE